MFSTLTSNTESGRVCFLWVGMPRTSFSIARKWDGKGPGPLRDADHLWGFNWLSGKDLAKVRQGNQLLCFSLRCMRLCEKYRIPYALENPMSSFAWLMPPVQHFIDDFAPS